MGRRCDPVCFPRPCCAASARGAGAECGRGAANVARPALAPGTPHHPHHYGHHHASDCPDRHVRCSHFRFCRQVNDPLYGLPPWAEGAASRIQSRWRGSKARQELGPAVAEHTAGRSAAAATVQRGLRRRAARRAAGEEVKQRRLQVSLPPTACKTGAHFASSSKFAEPLFSSGGSERGPSCCRCSSSARRLASS